MKSSSTGSMSVNHAFFTLYWCLSVCDDHCSFLTNCYHRLNRSSSPSPVLTATHHSYGSLTLSDFFLLTPTYHHQSLFWVRRLQWLRVCLPWLPGPLINLKLTWYLTSQCRHPCGYAESSKQIWRSRITIPTKLNLYNTELVSLCVVCRSWLVVSRGLDWIVQCFTSPPTQYRLYGRRFLQVKRPNQQYQSTEGDATKEKENNGNS